MKPKYKIINLDDEQEALSYYSIEKMNEVKSIIDNELFFIHEQGKISRHERNGRNAYSADWGRVYWQIKHIGHVHIVKHIQTREMGIGIGWGLSITTSLFDEFIWVFDSHLPYINERNEIDVIK